MTAAPGYYQPRAPTHPFVPSIPCPALLEDFRTVQRMMAREVKQQPAKDMFARVQPYVRPQHRATVVQWMSEVCEVERADPCVFMQSVNYLDRFLSSDAVHLKQLQLLACACMFIASKSRQPYSIPAKNLVDLTDNSPEVTLSSLMSWELLVLGRLQWDTSAVTSLDYIPHFLQPFAFRPSLVNTIAFTARHLCNAAAHDFDLSCADPSVVAFAAVRSAAVLHFGGDDCFQPCLQAMAASLQPDRQSSFIPRLSAVQQRLAMFHYPTPTASPQKDVPPHTPTDIENVVLV